jgi:hypothetical protein
MNDSLTQKSDVQKHIWLATDHLRDVMVMSAISSGEGIGASPMMIEVNW